MPIYQYQCGACGHAFEQLQKVSDDPIKVCPACSAESVQKLVSASGFKLTGTGWYETDFKNSGKAPAAKETGTKSNDTTKPESA